MAAGLSSRLLPLSLKKHKAMFEVNGEILIERQIKQLKDAGINEIIIVAGHLIEQFYYLNDKFDITIIENKEYQTRNNTSSLHAAKSHIGNSYICSCDNYFKINPFEKHVEGSYYSVLFSPDHTDEWCVQVDSNGFISNVAIGGSNQWYMMGHAFWAKPFSEKFMEILERNYDDSYVRETVWEGLLATNLDKLKIQIRRYNHNDIYEIDSIEDFEKINILLKG